MAGSLSSFIFGAVERACRHTEAFFPPETERYDAAQQLSSDLVFKEKVATHKSPVTGAGMGAGVGKPAAAVASNTAASEEISALLSELGIVDSPRVSAVTAPTPLSSGVDRLVSATPPVNDKNADFALDSMCELPLVAELAVLAAV
jgi:hypothetical protein